MNNNKAIITNNKKSIAEKKAYIKHHYKVLKVQYEYLDRMLFWCNKDSFKLVAHIISCQLYNYKEENEGYVPIPLSVRKSFCKQAKVDDLVKKGVVEKLVIDEEGRTYSVEFNICTNYRVREDIIEGFMKLEDMTATEYMKAAKVNLFTGKRCRAINKSKVVDYNNNRYPDIIVNAIKCINSCTFELAPVERHIDSLKHNMLGSEALYGKNSKEYKRDRGRYYNDNACLKNALNQNAEEILPGFYSFIPNYTVSEPGRIHTFMQNASREMKEGACHFCRRAIAA